MAQNILSARPFCARMHKPRAARPGTGPGQDARLGEQGVTQGSSGGLGQSWLKGCPSYGLGLLLCLCPSQPWSGLNPGRCPRALSPCSTGPRQLVFTAYSQLWTKHSTQFSPPSLHKPEGSRDCREKDSGISALIKGPQTALSFPFCQVRRQEKVSTQHSP